jgi:2-methylcitrate dehydratase
MEDGTWDHSSSYRPERAHRPQTIALWGKVKTAEDATWTERYRAGEAFGGRVVVELEDGTSVEDEMAVADAHPRGARPFGPSAYVDKFGRLTEGTIPRDEQRRFLDLVRRLPALSPVEVREVTFACPGLEANTPRGGLF